MGKWPASGPRLSARFAKCRMRMTQAYRAQHEDTRGNGPRGSSSGATCTSSGQTTPFQSRTIAVWGKRAEAERSKARWAGSRSNLSSVVRRVEHEERYTRYTTVYFRVGRRCDVGIGCRVGDRAPLLNPGRCVANRALTVHRSFTRPEAPYRNRGYTVHRSSARIRLRMSAISSVMNWMLCMDASVA